MTAAFLRRKDTEEYVKMLITITEEMAKDMIEISSCDDITVEELIESYAEWHNTPNVFESILIRNGALTLAEVKRNPLVEYMKNKNKEATCHD